MTNLATLDYEIVGFDARQGQLTVQCADLREPVTMPVPIVAGRFLAGPELHTYVVGFIPLWLIERSRAIRAGIINAADMQALVGTRRGDGWSSFV